MATNRIDQLLRAAADAFEDGRNPFDGDWLGEHAVTADECMGLSERIALVLRVYLAAPADEREVVQLAGAMALAGTDPAVAESAANKLRLHRAMGRLADGD